MKYIVYESPKRDNPKSRPHQSTPIAEDDVQARLRLEGKGWRIVQTLDESEVNPPTAERELLPVPGGEPVEGAAEVVSDEQGEPLLSPGVTANDLNLTAEQWLALQAAGYDTPDKLRGATDEELDAIEGIGPASVRNLRKALTAPEG